VVDVAEAEVAEAEVAEAEVAEAEGIEPPEPFGTSTLEILECRFDHVRRVVYRTDDGLGTVSGGCLFHGVGGVLGALFVLNAVGALVLALAMVVLRRRLLPVASVLSLLFMLGTLIALVLALTIGLFGIRETLDFQLVPTTLVVESIGTIMLAVTTVLVFQMRRGI
jgi:hypothetical protein